MDSLEDGPGLPGKPECHVVFPRTVDGVVGIDSNRIVVGAETSDDVFIHFGICNDNTGSPWILRTTLRALTAFVSRACRRELIFEDNVQIEKTLNCLAGTLALLTGCDNPKRGNSPPTPVPLPSDQAVWRVVFHQPVLLVVQYDDRWTLTEDGEFLYNNNGGTMNPFDGYIETQIFVTPSTYTLELQADYNVRICSG